MATGVNPMTRSATCSLSTSVKIAPGFFIQVAVLFAITIFTRSLPQGIDIHMQHHLAAFGAFQSFKFAFLAAGRQEVLRQCHQGIGAGVL